MKRFNRFLGLNRLYLNFAWRADDLFLKERYAFQAVKLACELSTYKQAQQLYDQLVKPLPKHAFMSDWALCRRAGATLALGDTARAIYEFAQVFDRCSSRRKAAETSLRTYGIRFRKEALDYAQTDRERAAVYALCAIQPGQDALDLLKEIVRLTPKNPLIELIMAREINRNEYYFFTTGEEYIRTSMSDHPDSVGFINRQEKTASYFDKLRSFGLESTQNKTLSNPAFWYTATAYLNYLGKDYKAAQSHVDQAVLQPITNPDLKKQITVQRVLLLAAQTEKITPETENQLIGYLIYGLPTDPIAKQKRFDALLHADYYTTARARDYFEQSTKVAKTPTLADRSAYMAARCEAHAFAVQQSIEQVRNGYVYEQDSTFVKDMMALRKANYARDYNDFYKNHTHTLFHKEMIQECAMYKDFLSFGAASE